MARWDAAYDALSETYAWSNGLVGRRYLKGPADRELVVRKARVWELVQ